MKFALGAQRAGVEVLVDLAAGSVELLKRNEVAALQGSCPVYLTNARSVELLKRNEVAALQELVSSISDKCRRNLTSGLWRGSLGPVVREVQTESPHELKKAPDRR